MLIGQLMFLVDYNRDSVLNDTQSSKEFSERRTVINNYIKSSHTQERDLINSTEEACKGTSDCEVMYV